MSLLRRLARLSRPTLHPIFEETVKHRSFFDTRDAITNFLFLEDAPAQVDLCFVLGSPSISSILPAVAMYHSGLAPRLLIAGYGPNPVQRPEAEVYRDYAVAHGVPHCAIMIEPRSRNTLENFQFSAAIIAREIGWSNLSRVAIAAKPFHMRRALMTARMNWPAHLSYLMRPSTAPDDALATNWWQSEAGRRFVLSEIRSIGTYGLENHIGGF